MEDIEDVGLDNTEVNCHKCAKASFKFRKVFKLVGGYDVLKMSVFQELFCQKCLTKGMYTADKVPQDYCKKCRKPKYFQKHLAYCEVKCTEYSPDEVIEEVISPFYLRVLEMKFVPFLKDLVNSGLFQDETIELTTSLTTPEITSSTTSSPDLGPLGNLLKLLVQVNTWRH